MFGFLVFNLTVAILRTMLTNPGNIPDSGEWDIATDLTADGELSDTEPVDRALEEQGGNLPDLTNDWIKENIDGWRLPTIISESDLKS